MLINYMYKYFYKKTSSKFKFTFGNKMLSGLDKKHLLIPVFAWESPLPFVKATDR